MTVYYMSVPQRDYLLDGDRSHEAVTITDTVKLLNNRHYEVH